MNNHLLVEALLFSIIVAACLTMIFITLEKWNFSQWLKVRTNFSICYYCASFWLGAILTCVYMQGYSPGNIYMFSSILMIPAFTMFIHNSPLKGL